MVTKRKHHELVWIDLESPSGAEIKEVITEYGIHPLVGENLLTPSLKPKVDLYKNCIYLILNFPVFGKGMSAVKVQEIDFIIGRNFIITNRYEPIEPLHKFGKIFEMQSVIGKDVPDHAGFLFFNMMRELYGELERNIETVESRLTDIEQKIFQGKEKEMVAELSHAGRMLLNLNHTLAIHKEVLESLEIAGEGFFGEDFLHYLTSITGDFYRIFNLIKRSSESVVELRETNNSLLSTKQNEVMKILTVVSFIVLPLTLIASVFQIDAVSRPIVGRPNDFWVIMGIMVIVAICHYIYFKFIKKWL